MKSEGMMMKKEGRGMAKADMQKAKPAKKMAAKPAKKMAMGGMSYAKGGLAAGHKQADGVAKKGKTKGMEVKMAKGGRSC